MLENGPFVCLAIAGGQSAAQVVHRVVAQPGHHRRSIRRGELLFNSVDFRRELLLPNLVETALEEGDQPLEILPLRMAGKSVEEAADPAFEQKPSDCLSPSVEEPVRLPFDCGLQFVPQHQQPGRRHLPTKRHGRIDRCLLLEMEPFGLQPRQLLSGASQPFLPFENRLQRFGFGLNGAEKLRRVCFSRIPRVDLGRDGSLDDLCFDEGRLSLAAAQQGGEKSQPLLLQLLDHIFDGRVIVRDDQHGLLLHHKIGHDVEDRLRLAGSRRPLDDADLIPEGCLDGSLLAGVAPEGVDELRHRELSGRALAGIQVKGRRRTVRDEIDLLVLHQQQFLPIIGLQRIEFRHVAQIGEAILCGWFLQARPNEFDLRALVVGSGAVGVFHIPESPRALLESGDVGERLYPAAFVEQMAMLRIEYNGILQPQHFARDIGVGLREMAENDLAAVGP